MCTEEELKEHWNKYAYSSLIPDRRMPCKPCGRLITLLSQSKPMMTISSQEKGIWWWATGARKADNKKHLINAPGPGMNGKMHAHIWEYHTYVIFIFYSMFVFYTIDSYSNILYIYMYYMFIFYTMDSYLNISYFCTLHVCILHYGFIHKDYISVHYMFVFYTMDSY